MASAIFIEAASSTWGKNLLLHGHEINKSYIELFTQRCPEIAKRANIQHADFFNLNLEEVCGGL